MLLCLSHSDKDLNGLNSCHMVEVNPTIYIHVALCFQRDGYNFMVGVEIYQKMCVLFAHFKILPSKLADYL